jgi:hypothetical protein
LRARQPAPNSRLVAGDGLIRSRRTLVCGGNIVSMFDRVAKLRCCVAHFEDLLHPRGEHRDGKGLRAPSLQRRHSEPGKCAALTARGQDKLPRSF